MEVLVALALPEALISAGESPHSLLEGVNSLSPTPNLGQASTPSYPQAGNSCNCPHHFHSVTGAWWGGEYLENVSLFMSHPSLLKTSRFSTF